MATTVLTSIPCPTEDMAKNSLLGSIAEFGKGGHKVSVKDVTTMETEAGWIATYIIDIEDLEEEEEQTPEDRVSEARKAEEIIERENELYALTHFHRDSQAERSFPDAGEPPNADEITQMDTTPQLEDQPGTIGVDQNVEDLSKTFEEDFSQALTPEPPPEGTVPDTALAYTAVKPPEPDVPVSDLSVEELEAEVERRKKEQEDMAAALAARGGEEPTPLPTE